MKMRKWMYCIIGCLLGIACTYGTVCFIQGFTAIGALAFGFVVITIAVVMLLSTPAGLDLGKETNKIPCAVSVAEGPGSEFVDITGETVLVICDKGFRVRKDDKISYEFTFDSIMAVNIKEDIPILMYKAKNSTPLVELSVMSKLKKKVLFNCFDSKLDSSIIKYA